MHRRAWRRNNGDQVCIFDGEREGETMNLAQVTETILAAKKAKGMTFADLEKAVGRDKVWIAPLKMSTQ